MEAIVRTVYGVYMQTVLFTGRPAQIFDHTTLNEKLAINASMLPGANDRPSLGYYAYGNRGHKNVVGAEGIPKSEPVQHLATDAGLYGQLPFVLRELNNDLDAASRAKYGLRREETHNGVTYAAYYLRRLDMSNVVPGMELKTITDGVTTTTPFVPNTGNLNPTPPAVANTGVDLLDGNYVTVAARLNLTISEAEAQEMLNVARVLYNDEQLAIISELALVTGLDKNVTITSGNGSSFNMLEVIAAQIAAFAPAMFPIVFSNTGVGITLDVGSSEPLFKLSA